LPDDAGAYRALRVRSLREHPEAFGRTPEEVEPVDAIAARAPRRHRLRLRCPARRVRWRRAGRRRRVSPRAGGRASPHRIHLGRVRGARAAPKTGSLKVGDHYYDEELMALYVRGHGTPRANLSAGALSGSTH